MNRDDFFARIREAVQAGNRYRVDTAEVPRRALYADPADDAVGRYVDEVNRAGGRAVRMGDRAAAREVVTQWLLRYEPRSALCWRHPTLERFGLDALLREHGIERIDAESTAALSRASARTKRLSADVGITSATFAVAETGSLVMVHASENDRSASLVPPVHLAVIERRQIVADLFDVFEQLAAGRMPANVTFITGPSKTGDIESKLVTGVHGPGKWHVVVIDAD